MFEATHPFALFDELRVPYALFPVGDGGGWGTLRWTGAGASRTVRWPLAADGAVAEHRLEGIPIFGRVVPGEPGPGWDVAAAVTDGDGAAVAAVGRDAAGSLVLPFDPAELLVTCWSERYRRIGRGTAAVGAMRVAKRLYYRARPLLPRAVQLRLRRRFTAVQEQAAFPRWPLEPALHEAVALLMDLLAGVAGEPLPSIAAWPEGRTWALVLTHDVETGAGLRNLALLRDLEVRHGVRSAWNLVPRRYDVGDALVAGLLADGFEVGVHGLRHDGRDLASPALRRRRLPEMHAWAERWRASGFRSPALNRDWSVMGSLDFDYDSSYPDTDPYQPDPGGCCWWLPFFNGDTVELPITLPQDHTLLEILGRREPVEWFDKARELRRRGGMALLITHPDYMAAPARLDAYDRFLDAFAHDPGVWAALPRDVAAWWRRRAASTIERASDGWAIRGPAAGEARVELVGAVAAAQATRAGAANASRTA